MENLFNDKYYNASDDEGKDLEKQKDIDMQLMDDKFDKVGQDQGDDGDMVSDSELEQGEKDD